MSELFDQIISQRGTLENWMNKVPGLKGVMDRGDRREADRMLRAHIADQLTQRMSRFAGIEKQILKSGGLSLMSDTRDAKQKFQTYIDKVKAAPPGYSGFFAAVNVDEDALARLYAFDEAQLRYVDQFDQVLSDIEAAAGSGEGLEAAIQTLYNTAQEAIDAFALREDVLTNLNQQYSSGA